MSVLLNQFVGATAPEDSEGRRSYIESQLISINHALRPRRRRNTRTAGTRSQETRPLSPEASAASQLADQRRHCVMGQSSPADHKTKFTCRFTGRQSVKQPILVQPKVLSDGTALELHLNAEQLRVGAAQDRGTDRGAESDSAGMGRVLQARSRPNALPQTRRLDRATPLVASLPALAVCGWMVAPRQTVRRVWLG